MTSESPHRSRLELIEEAIPQFESFLESREEYIHALEATIEALTGSGKSPEHGPEDVRRSIDELVAMQRMANAISTSANSEIILRELIALTRQVLPVLEADIFLFDEEGGKLSPIAGNGAERLLSQARTQMESGVLDWIFAEKKTIVIPEIDDMTADGKARSFVLVPLMMRNTGIGIYLIHTPKHQQEFTNQDLQILSVLTNQAAAGVENWRAHNRLRVANDQLKASEAQMIQAAKLAAIGELAAGIVHEIKNPVQVLILQMDLMRKGVKLPNEQQLLFQQVQRLSEITKRLMNFVRSTSAEVVMRPVCVNKPIQDVVAIVEHEFRTEKVTIVQDLAADLPEIQGSADYLQQVFLNLCINARDAMPAGGTLSIRTTSDAKGVTIVFADTGSGIRKEFLTKIFQPFFTTKEEGKGTGLGLAICRKIISRHDGTIAVSSEPGAGTQFTITIPFENTL